jgi:membrane protease YdiL (CAAX protease family)
MLSNNSRQRSIVVRIFLSPDERRLRAGWRLLIQTLLMAIIGVGLSALIAILPSNFVMPVDGLITVQLLELLVIGGSIYLARRLLDKRDFVSLGFKINGQAWQDLLLGICIPGIMMGFIIPGIMMGFIFVIEWSFGWLTFEGFAWQFDPLSDVFTNAIIVFLIFILVGWNEELLTRGYHLQTIASGSNLGWGIFLSSAVFGILHLGNPNATWLWLSIGLHIGWNYFEGTVFGFPVSGMDVYRLTHISVDGPVLWTGGAFGPEAGFIVVPALLLGTGLIWAYTRWRAGVDE